MDMSKKRGKPQEEEDKTDEETESEEEEDEDEDNEEQLSVDSKAKMILKKTNEIKKSIDFIHELEKEIMSSPAFKSLSSKKTEEIDDASENEESFHKQKSQARRSSYHRKLSPRSLSKLRSEVAKRIPRDEYGRFTSESESDDDEWTPDEDRSPSPRRSKRDRYGRSRKLGKRRHYSSRSLSRLRSEIEEEDEDKRSKKTSKQKRLDEVVEKKTKPKSAAPKKRLQSHPREQHAEEKKTPRKQGRPSKKVTQSKSSTKSPKNEELSAGQTPEKKQSKQADPEPQVLKDDKADQEEFESPKRLESIKLNLTENVFAVSTQ